MTNEEKAKKILKQFNFTGSHPGNKVYGFTLDRMKQIAIWKEQQMIEKACEWLEKNVAETTVIDSYAITESFKQAMENNL